MKLLTWFLGACLGVAASTANGASLTVVETFGCTYLEGKNRADLDAAIEIWTQKVAAINNVDLNRYQAFVLTPLRATTEFDFVWLGVSPNLAIWGNGLDAFSSRGADVPLITQIAMAIVGGVSGNLLWIAIALTVIGFLYWALRRVPAVFLWMHLVQTRLPVLLLELHVCGALPMVAPTKQR